MLNSTLRGAELPDFFKSRLGNDVICGLCFLLIYLFVYFPLCLRNGLHWDEVFDTAGRANGTYIAAGRWGLSLYRWVFGLGYLPLISGIAAGGFLAVALVLQVKLIGIKSRYAKLSYGLLYFGCVQWAAQLQYSHQSDAIALAILCVTVAAYLFFRQNRRSNVAAVALVVYACAVYQTAMLYLLALIILRYVAGADSMACVWRGVVRPFVWIFIAGCLYLLTSVISKSISLVSPADLFYMKCVQASMSKWPEILSASSPSEMIHLLIYYAGCYSKVIIKNLLGLTYEGQWIYATLMLPIGWLSWRYWSEKRDCVRVAGLLIAWVLPFVMALVVMTDQGARVSLAEPLVLAGIWGVWIKSRGERLRHRWVMVALCGFVMLKGAYRCAIIADDERNEYASKMENVQNLNARLMVMADASGMASPDVIYFGEMKKACHNPYVKRWGKRRDKQVLPSLPDGTMPEEFCMPIRKAGNLEMAIYSEQVKVMPIWPAPGSIRAADGVIIIKFSE